MGDVKGFLKHDRRGVSYRPVSERVSDYLHVQESSPEESVQVQASRCMDCGIPFCNNGCPLGNIIPDFNDLVYRGRWQDALERLHSTNNFPEFTGMVCPAPCEQACVLGINRDPVTIKQVEWEIVSRGWDEGWIKPIKPARRTGRRVAVVGSGPAGLSAAQQLNRVGHQVTVFEKNDRIGGLLRYGIPDFKLEKWVIDRRVQQMREEGVAFKTGVNVGLESSALDVRSDFDAVLLAIGSEQPRDLPVEGRTLEGVHFAMDYLVQQNRRLAGDSIPASDELTARGKHVVILGGGDTGSDCIGTAHRQGAASVTSLELLPRPPEGRHASEPWPLAQKMVFNVSSSHAEGGDREYAVQTSHLSGKKGAVRKLHAVRLQFESDSLERPQFETMSEVQGSAFDLPADLVLLAMGFLHPIHEGVVEKLGVALDARRNVQANCENFVTDQPGIFAAGDCRRGQSLVVWAQWEGREAARAVDIYLMGESSLQSRTFTP